MSNDQQANVVLTADNSGYDSSMRASTTVTNSLVSSVVALSTGMNTLAQRAGRKIELVSVGSLATLTAATVAAAKFDSAMSTMSAQAIMTGRSYDQMVKQVNTLRGSFAVSTDSAIALQTQLAKMGQGGAGIEKISQSMLKLGAVTGESVGMLTNGLIGLQRQMDTVGSGYTERFASALANVSAKAGVSAQSVLDFSNSIAPVAKVAGLSQKEVMGFSAAFVKAGQDGGAAATAFNKMLTDITRSVQYGSPELKAYANLIGVSVEQFKALPRSEAVIRIFEQISKQGPDAIKTLERFGLDGVRTYKALQGVASQGGIRSAFADVSEGYADTAKFNAAAKTSMDGLNENLQQLGNNLTMVGEAFGKAFVGPAKAVVSAINSVVMPLASMLQSLGSIPGVTALAGTAMLGLGGIVVRSLGLMTGIAAVRSITGGTTAAGFRSARQGENAPLFARNAARTFESGGGSALQRATFMAGRYLGNALPSRGAEREGPGFLSRVGALGVRGVGAFARSQLDALQPRRFWNPMATSYAGTGAAGAEVGRSIANTGLYMKETFAKAFNRTDMASQAASARAANTALNEMSRSTRAQAGLFKTLGTETMRLAATMGKAAVSSVAMGGGGAMKVGGALGKGALGLLGGFLGGPVGIGLTAGVIGLSMYQQHKEDEKFNLGLGKTAEATDAAGGVYRVALGEAAAATTTFAAIVKQNAAAMGGTAEKPGVVSAKMAQDAAAPGRKYTDERIGNMTQAQAQTYANSAQMSDQDRVLFGYDLTKRFGRETAQSILDNQTSQKGQLDLTNLYSGIRGNETFYKVGQGNAASQAATKMATATGQQNLADIQTKYGDKAGAQYVISSLNAGQKNIMTGGNRDQTFSALAGLLGVDSEDEKNKRDFQYLLAPSIDRDKNGTQRVTAANFQTAIDRLKADPKSFSSAFAQSLLSLSSTAGPGANYASTTFSPSQLLANGGTNQLFNIATGVQSNVRAGGALGNAVLQNNQIGNLLNTAVGQQGNANLQEQATKQLADAAMSASGGLAAASSQLQRMKDAVGDVNDPLYQLANNAQAVVAQRQAEQMHYMTRAGVAGQVGANFLAAQEDASRPGAGTDAETRLESARQALEGQKAAAYDFFRQLVVQERELGIQQSRAQKDYATQRGYQEHDYNLQRKRAQDDFTLSRTRQDQQYARQQTRQLRDYNLNRSYSYADFSKQRLRSEADFQHQVVLMTQQASQQVYNIYERVNVARTWSAANLMTNATDQLQRLNQQSADLETARKAGVSSDVIKLLGLNETANAQQLARFVADIAADPSVVKAFNEMAVKRQEAAKKIVTDKDSVQWQEMQRSFTLNANRAAEDFNTSMKRQAAGFAVSLRDMRTDYNISVSQAEADFSKARDRQETDYNTSVTRMATQFGLQMSRARDDLSRSAEEITGSFDTLAKSAIKGLTGTAQKQAQALQTTLDATAKKVKKTSATLIQEVAQLFGTWTGATTGNSSANAAEYRAGTGSTTAHGSANAAEYGLGHASGGYIDGWSPHKRADNIPAKLTAGEYVQQVDAVNHYGVGFMDAINSKRFPKELALHFDRGGLVNFGHQLQQMGYQVGEHPLFGGVHPVHAPGSWHYKAGAIDVNHDQGGEKAALNAVISKARQYGLRVIWQVANHFDHAHFDIGTGPDMIGPGVPRGGRTGDGGLLKAIQSLSAMKTWRKLVAGSHALSLMTRPDDLAKLIGAAYSPPGSGDTMAAPSRGHAASNATLGRQMAARRGWTGGNWDALNWIYMHESGWNEKATNPSSGAYGIPQALPGTKMASAGADWRTNPATQIKWGLGYIAQRYGTPMDAQSFWKAHNWYGNGGVFAGGGKTIGVGERGPEMVLPLNQQGVEYLLAVMRQYGLAEAQRATGSAKGTPVSGSTYISNTRVDRSTSITGPITVQSNDPRDMLRKLEAQKRVDALTGPRSH